MWPYISKHTATDIILILLSIEEACNARYSLTSKTLCESENGNILLKLVGKIMFG